MGGQISIFALLIYGLLCCESYIRVKYRGFKCNPDVVRDEVANMQLDKTSLDVKTTTISTKGQTTIPKEIRDSLGIEPGDEITWIRKRRTIQVEIE